MSAMMGPTNPASKYNDSSFTAIPERPTSKYFHRLPFISKK
jgi:hypothetical protein